MIAMAAHIHTLKHTQLFPQLNKLLWSACKERWCARMSHSHIPYAFVRQRILRCLNKSASGNSTRSHLFNGAKRSAAQIASHYATSSPPDCFRDKISPRAATLRGFIPRLIRILRVTESLPHSERALSLPWQQQHARTVREQHLLLFKWQLLFHSNYTCARHD